MAKITLKGNAVDTSGNLPAVGTNAPDFTGTKTDLSDLKLSELKGKRVILNIFPSIDTPTCATSVRTFNAQASKMDNTVVLCISADLPFAQKRFCGAEGLNNVVSISTFRFPNFGNDYGANIVTGALSGLLSRAVVVVDENGKVKYTEQVAEIANEPNYDAALQALA